MNKIIKRLKSKSIWLGILTGLSGFMVSYNEQLRSIMNEYYNIAFVTIGFLIWIVRELTNKSLDDK